MKRAPAGMAGMPQTTSIKKLLVLILGGALAFASLGSACDKETDSPPPTTPGPNGECIGSTKCGKECVSLQSDRNNCGACGKVCPDGQSCANSGCTSSPPPPPTCDAPKLSCNGSCTDVKTSTSHCGACNNACPPNVPCSDGTCLPSDACPNGQIKCSGTCTNPMTDKNNCGDCGVKCGMLTPVCINGKCVG